MKRLQEISTKQLSIILGLLFFAITVFLLYFRPQESWYDDAFWADWAYKLSKGEFVTHVWGGGQPSYSPLYALIMALWYKVVGFSFFTAQLPNLIFALMTYLVICLRFKVSPMLRTNLSIIGFAICFWFSDTLFWIFSCGRVDTLCLLLGILTIDAFIQTYEIGGWKNYLLFCLWSCLEMATGFEGVMFVAVFIVIYSCLQIRISLSKWYIYIGYAFSSILSFGAVLAWMVYHNCGKAFLRTIFGFSYTLNTIFHFIETGNMSFENNVPLNDTMTLLQKINSLTIDGVANNKEYLVLICFVIILMIIFIVKDQWKIFASSSKMFIIGSILIPWVYVLAGRYATYYSWAAYVPCIIALFVLLQNIEIEKILVPLLCIGMVTWFIISPQYSDLKRVDFKRDIDTQNLKDIAAVQINPNEATYIPYKWYYYLATSNNNLYFQGSSKYPKIMTKMILRDEQEITEWGKVLELEYVCDIRQYKLYKVLGDREQHFLK
ncbi:MAG: glycosyltransferase family 39 protein [Paludibacteraceae bacterium]|nr:glycosyltransferase family 39 protein [Paludibacteraceae bacterium]